MTPSDPSPERLERMKKVLEDSYPRVAKDEREPLPESVMAALKGESAPAASRAEPREGALQRFLAWFRGPQLAGVGVAATLVIAAVLFLRPDDGAVRGGGGEPGATVVVLHALTEAQEASLRSSNFFRPELLREVPEGTGLADFLADLERPGLIVVDGKAGTISTPFAGEDAPEPMEFSAETEDLAPLLLDILSEVPQEPTEPTPAP